MNESLQRERELFEKHGRREWFGPQVELDSRHVEERRRQVELDSRGQNSGGLFLAYERMYGGKTPEEIQKMNESLQRERELFQKYGR